MRRLLTFVPIVVLAAACSSEKPAEAPAQAAAPPAAPAMDPVKRGEYLVGAVGVCDDCHTPKILKPTGPDLDMSKRLSGHQASIKPSAVPKNVIGPRPQDWGALGNNDFTAWAGPWGVSFARNLTPDVATGLGSWTEDMFIKSIREGKHQGEGRPLLPPMPWPVYKSMTDEDLKAVWAFLRTLPPINNPVPDPIPPAGAK